MSVENTEEYLMISGIQHFEFCERQWALIHIEQQWKENRLTFEGGLIHERADDPFIVESSGDRFVSRSMPIVSNCLRVYGVADVVEFIRCDNGGAVIAGRDGLWKPYPVEYKHGKAKNDDCDVVQLCVQAICLEEMLGVAVNEGAMYYHKTRRRLKVEFDGAVRAKTIETAEKMHAMFAAGVTPKAVYMKRCENCSMIDLCCPKTDCRSGMVDRYIKSYVEDGM